ncbi:LapA family protein [Achromobacter sp. GG226]|uniref:LapA family protein n=1 Tax=Verticiella alkaliphila TaxID=2779529 RepID=UPI001C0E29E1|nr:LapA family protein [Verticiella sp. GG226]MBU4609949.1 LapA family protein [Verticiella sp. GG226]
MRYVVWGLRLLVFVAVLMFALKNTDPVTVRFYADHLVTEVPLIVVMLSTFVVGAIFGLLLTVPANLRRRRELAKVRRENERLRQFEAEHTARTQANAAPSPDEVAPLSPL